MTPLSDMKRNLLGAPRRTLPVPLERFVGVALLFCLECSHSGDQDRETARG